MDAVAWIKEDKDRLYGKNYGRNFFEEKGRMAVVQQYFIPGERKTQTEGVMGGVMCQRSVWTPWHGY